MTAPRRDYAVVVSARSIGFVVMTVVVTLLAVVLVDRASVVFALLGAAFTAALIAAPLVDRLSRWMPRGAGILLVTLAGIVGTIAVLGVVAWDLDRQAGALREAIHEAIEDLPPDSSAAEVAADLRLDERAGDVLDGAAARLVVGDTDPLAVATQVGKVVLVAVMAAFMVAGGRGLLSKAIQLVRRTSIREQFHGAVDDAGRRAGAYLRRTIVVSVVHGAAASLVAELVDIPAALSLGVWVALLSTVPILGGLLGWLPIVTLGVVVGDVPAFVMVAIALVLIVADRLVRARWVHAALHVGPLLATFGIGIGVYVIGISGALLGLLVVAIVAAVLSRDDHLGGAIVDLVEDPQDRTIPEAEDMPVELEPVLAEPREHERYLRLRPSGRTAAAVAVVIVGAVALVQIVGEVRSLVVWFAVAAFVAFGLDRPISALHRKWSVPRAAGTGIVVGAMVGLVAAVIVLAGPSITNSAQEIAKDAPETVESMESLPIVGGLLERNGAPEKVEEFLRSIPDRLRDSDAVERIANAAGDGLTGLFWTVTLMLAILWDGPRLVRAIRDRIPAERRLRSIHFGRAAYTAVSKVVAASAFVAALNGSIVMLLAIALGIPLAPVLGLWAATWNFIPQIGGFVSAVPLVALGFGRGPWQGVIALLVFVTYQTFENHVIQPFVGSRVVKVPPLVFLVGALFGGALAGFVGALMAAPILGVGKVALTMISGDDERIDDLVRRE